MAKTVKTKMVPPDGGWGWVVLISALTVNLLIPGTLKSFGVLFVEFLHVFKSSSTAASWMPALCYFLYNSLGPLSSILSKKYSYKTVTLIGGAFASCGMMLSYFANSVTYLYVSYGLMVGIGAGLTYPPTIYIVTAYFEKWRGFANGLCVSGSAIGTILLPPFLQYLLDCFGYRGAVLIMGALTLNTLVCAMLYHPVEQHMKMVVIEEGMDNEGLSLDEEKCGTDKNRQSTLSIEGKQDETSKQVENLTEILDGHSSSKDQKDVEYSWKSSNVNFDQSYREEGLENEGKWKLRNDLRSSLRKLEGTSKQLENLTEILDGRSSLKSYKKNEEDATKTKVIRAANGSDKHFKPEVVGNEKPEVYRKLNEEDFSGIDREIVKNVKNLRSTLRKQEEARGEMEDNFHSYKEMENSWKNSNRKSINPSQSNLEQDGNRVKAEAASAANGNGKNSKPEMTDTQQKTEIYRKLDEANSEEALENKEPFNLERKGLRRFFGNPWSRFKKEETIFQPEVYRSISEDTLAVPEPEITIPYSLVNDEEVEVNDLEEKSEVQSPIDKSQSQEERLQVQGLAEKQVNSISTEDKSVTEKFFDFSVLRDPIYLVILISNTTSAISNVNFMILLPSYAIEEGFDKHSSAWLLSIVSALDLVGRISGSSLSDIDFVPKYYYFVGGLGLSGIALALLPMATSYTMLSFFCALFGLSSGMYIGITTVILADMLGTEKLASSYGISLFVNGVLQLIGPPICGIIFENVGSYKPIFLAFGIILILGTALWAVVPLIKRNNKKNLEAV
ncbi:uncharacterized protein [Prorops nasuta]|uniref:uncharacterized protein n=1 Tax=Prorops nasuta TaxID=863751 RepID=UPI0034CF3DCD